MSRDVRVAAQVVLGARGEHKVRGARVRCLGGRRDALAGRIDVVQPLLAGIPILDRAARKADLEREPHGLGDAGGVRGEAVLEVRRHGHVGSGDERRGVRERLLAT